MQIDPRHRRTWIAALSITSLLLGQSRALAVRWDPELDPRLLAASSGRDSSDERSPFRIVTWPDSLRLVGVTDGEWTGDPFPGPDVCGNSIHIPYRKGAGLSLVVTKALTADRRHLEVMRHLATEASDGALNTGDRAALDAAFQVRIAMVDSVSETTFWDIPVMDGTVDICVDGVPVFFDLPDATDTALDLTGGSFDLTTVTNAAAALATVDQALDTVQQYRVEIRRDALALRDGPADGGLREQQRVLERMQDLAFLALDGTLNTGDRMALSAFYQDDLERTDAIAENVSFEGIELLDGTTDVGLRGRSPLAVPILLDLPDTTATALGIEGTLVDTYSNALTALATVDAALVTVTEHRERMIDTALDLMDG